MNQTTLGLRELRLCSTTLTNCCMNKSFCVVKIPLAGCCLQVNIAEFHTETVKDCLCELIFLKYCQNILANGTAGYSFILQDTSNPKDWAHKDWLMTTWRKVHFQPGFILVNLEKNGGVNRFGISLHVRNVVSTSPCSKCLFSLQQKHCVRIPYLQIKLTPPAPPLK